MRWRRVLPILLLAAVFTGGVAGGWGVGRAEKATTALAAGIFGQKAVRAQVTVAAEIAPAAARQRQAGEEARFVAPVKLAEDETALVAEIGDLQLLAQRTDLALDADQWSRLAAVTLGVQAIRQNYEAEIARATAVGPGRYRVEIPGYTAAGVALRKKFYAELGATLGDAVAAEVIEKLGARLEGHFGGFGVSLQTLEVATGSGATDVEITRTVNYATRGATGDELVIRRETHLPAWEDPGGERWGALLGVIARRAGSNS